MAQKRTAKSCGPDASTLAFKFLRSKLLRDDGDKRARSPGRARRKPLAPSRAGMPGDPGATVVTNARVYYHYTRGCGCIEHPAFPTPSLGGNHMHNPGASRRGNADVCLLSSLRGAERRSNPLFLSAVLWIASRSLSSGAHSRGPLARNDDPKVARLFEIRICNTPRLSSPAKAGDPVLRDVSILFQTPAFTGYPLGSRHKCNTC